ncbi:TPA: single-stranded DNA-binding protein [Streptococcus suis]
MKVTNKGYINFSNEYNKKTETMMTASMSFANGKNEDGNWKNGYINVVAFRENIPLLENAVDQLVEIEGTYRLNEYINKQGQVIKTPQIIIDKFLSGAANASDSYPKNEAQPFGDKPMELSDDDLPF